MTSAAKTDESGLVGLVPAAGSATRLGALPCSKEIYPLGPQTRATGGDPRIRVPCHDLLEAFAVAGASETYVVLGKGKWDIPAYLGDGADLGLQLAYLTIDRSPSTLHTVSRAQAFVADRRVAFGFPDIVFAPTGAVAQLDVYQRATGADVVLGLFPAHAPEKMDMVEVATNGEVRRIVVKPQHTELELTWILAVWTPRFTGFIHRFVTATGAGPGQLREQYVGDAIQAAITDGWRVEGIPIRQGRYRDVGTPADLAHAVREHAVREHLT